MVDRWSRSTRTNLLIATAIGVFVVSACGTDGKAANEDGAPGNPAASRCVAASGANKMADMMRQGAEQLGGGGEGVLNGVVAVIPPGGEAAFVHAICDLQTITDTERQDPNLAMKGLPFCSLLWGNNNNPQAKKLTAEESITFGLNQFPDAPKDQVEDSIAVDRAAHKYMCPQFP
jgi:hypothetical protein